MNINTVSQSLLGIMLSVYGMLAVADTRFADSHTHFNWDQKEIISATEVIDILDEHGVDLTIVAGTPSELALELREAGDERIVPFFSPYIHELGKRDWFLKQEVVERASDGLEKGLYHGVGEVHFMNGFLPKTDNEIFQQLIHLARKHDVPMLIHIDSSNEVTFKNLCEANPDIRLIFAHAGGELNAGHIVKIIEACPNVWIDFAARDPWRYGGLTKEDNTLLDDWRELVIRHPDRFITGTDPVWKVTRWSTWDSSDEGWSHYHRLHEYHMSWLDDLPEDVRNKIAWENTQRLLGRVSSD